METKLTIDGYDFTNNVKDIPVIDHNLPEWGQVTGQIVNESLNLSLHNSYNAFFENGRKIQDIQVIVNQGNRLVFKGFIDKLSYSLGELTLNCKSKTSILFNSYLQGNGDAYVIDEAYPIDIIKEILLLAGLQLNEQSYVRAFNIHNMLDMRFSVTTTNINYMELLEKICELSCSIIYIENDEFYYDMFDNTKIYPSIEIEDIDWIDYPIIETPPAFSSVFNGIDVRFGNNLLLNGLKNPSKIIDMSYSSPVYTTNLIIANYIADLYDCLGKSKKQIMKGKLKYKLGAIINKQTYIKWQGISYKMVNINTKSKLGTDIIAEAII